MMKNKRTTFSFASAGGDEHSLVVSTTISYISG